MMAEYETEEQQVEALKNWWKENGTSVIAGVVIGVGGLLGWRGWAAYQENQATAASTYYEAMQVAVSEGDVDTVVENTRILREDYSATPYGALAALSLAKLKAEADDLAVAETQLRWALENTKQDALRHVARIRLARVLVSQGKHTEALDLVGVDLPVSFLSLVDEIRGDAFSRQGEVDKAREAYDRALISAKGETEYLQMKRDDLGDAPVKEDS